MGQHGPEAAQGFRRHARSQLRNVALQIRADKIFAPDRACRVALREKDVRKSAPDPEFFARIVLDFENVERTQFDMGDPAGEGFSRLPEQFHRGRAQQQKSAAADASTPPPVDQAAQRLEQFRRSLHFVEDDQLVFMPGQIQGGVGQLLAVRRVFEIEINARPLFRNKPG